MPIVTNSIAYHKAEIFGRENSGKSVYAYSLCQMMRDEHKDMKIEVFTNESSYAETLKLFPEHKDKFVIRLSRSLDEFRTDWVEFCTEYGIKLVKDPKTKLETWNVSGVEKRVFGIIIDEGKFIYDEFIEEHYENNVKTDGIDKRMQQKDYGPPRQKFIKELKRLFMLPAHCIVTSKVKEEYEEKETYSQSSGRSFKQWVRTGGDDYALPPLWVYEPANRIHLINISTPKWKPIVKGKKLEPILNPITKLQESDFKSIGEVLKQKADRSKQLVIQNITVKKLELQLKLLARAAAKKI